MDLQDKTLVADGVEIRYRDTGGPGMPLVLIHGIACSLDDWEMTIPALAQDRRVIALDLPGCGLSAKPASRSYTLEESAGAVLALMDSLAVEEAHFGGFSLGGHVALICAKTAPLRVRSLLLQSPAGMGRRTIINFRLATLPLLGEILTLPGRSSMRMLMKLAVFDPALVSDELVEFRLGLARQPGAQAAFLKMLRSFSGLSGFEPTRVAALDQWLPKIDMPALVIWGSGDKFVPVEHAGLLKARLPDCRVSIYERCGHLPNAEHRDRFNAEAAAFLAEVDARAA